MTGNAEIGCGAAYPSRDGCFARVHASHIARGTSLIRVNACHHTLRFARLNLNTIAFRIGKVDRLTHHIIGSALHEHAIRLAKASQAPSDARLGNRKAV
jgi:hypothetical protein